MERVGQLLAFRFGSDTFNYEELLGGITAAGSDEFLPEPVRLRGVR